MIITCLSIILKIKCDTVLFIYSPMYSLPFALQARDEACSAIF